MEVYNMPKEAKNDEFIKYAFVLIVFAIICLITAGIFNMNRGKVYHQTLAATGGEIGPIEVKKDRSVYFIKVKQNVPTSKWSFITTELLDDKKEYLCGFGKEFWQEEGRDSEGYWREAVNSYKMKITIPKKGRYYLNFDVEKNDYLANKINIIVSKKNGSALPFFLVGLLALFIGIAININHNLEV
ncbi:MAG: hypothetical protein GY817_01860 [bacterium]|nr:hypothetical protein [bacterium]